MEIKQLLLVEDIYKGAILINNFNTFKLAKHLTTTAKVRHSWDFYHDQVAWNYRMS